MRLIAIGAGLAVLAVLVLGLSFVFDWRALLGPKRVQPDPLPLPSERIAALLWPDQTPRGMVVFHDGADGWFAIDDTGALADIEIGFFGRRLGEALVGANRHLPIYCGGDAQTEKIVWAIEDGQIGRQLAFCSAERMDLSPLRPLARPVTMHHTSLTRPEVIALTDRIAADPALDALSLPQDFAPFDQVRMLTLPAYWYRWGDGTASGGRVDAALGAALAAHMEGHAGDYAARSRDLSAQELTRFDAEGPQDTGPALDLNGATVILTGVNWITLPRFEVGCRNAACDALEGFDPRAALAPVRDLALLERALADPVPLDRAPGPEMFTPEDLRREDVTLGPVTPVTYDVRWIAAR